MISAEKNYYQILDVGASATPDEIKKSYRKLAMKYHPDHNPKRRSAEERFKLLQQAYDTLSDPERRQQYDLSLVEGEREEQLEIDWRLAWVAPHILPFLLGAVVGTILGFSALVKAYTPALDSWVWGVVFLGGGAVIGGVVASFYFARKTFY